MFQYFEKRENQYKLSDTKKIAVSLRLDIKIVDKSDMLAIKEERSRNFIINRLLSDTIRIFEERNGQIKVDAEVLKKLRRT